MGNNTANMKKITLLFQQKRFLFISIPLLIIAVVIAIDGFFIEPFRPQLIRVHLTLAHLPPSCSGLTIVQFSDIHFDAQTSPPLLKQVVSITNQAHPDVIVLTGDYSAIINWNRRQRIKAITDLGCLLGSLHALDGVYAILGNHDRGDIATLRTVFASQNITLLQNQAVPISYHSGQVWLAGLDDIWMGHPQPEQTIRHIPTDACVIALVHEPDYAQTLAQFPIDLQLSGHSHGGQHRLPFFGPIYTPADSKRYPAGLYNVGKMLEYTNRGIGMTGPPLRINDRPEITLFTLVAK